MHHGVFLSQRAVLSSNAQTGEDQQRVEVGLKEDVYVHPLAEVADIADLTRDGIVLART